MTGTRGDTEDEREGDDTRPRSTVGGDEGERTGNERAAEAVAGSPAAGVDIDATTENRAGTRDGEASAADGGADTALAPADGDEADSAVEAASARSEERVPISIHQTDYTVIERSDGKMPVVHLFGRTTDDRLLHVEVTGFTPYFYVDRGTAAADDEWSIRRVESVDTPALDGTPVDRVTTIEPRNVGHVRNEYDPHYEADIPFPDRFLIDRGIEKWASVPLGDATLSEDERTRVTVTDPERIRPVSPDAADRADLRVTILDIEVEDRNGFPEADEAAEPILSITVWDSFLDEYRVLLHRPDDAPDAPAVLPDYTPISAMGDGDGSADADDSERDGDPDRDDRDTDAGMDCSIHSFDSEEAMLAAFVNYLRESDPDLLAAWNMNDFDAPYIANRLDEIDVSESVSDVPVGCHDEVSADALSRVDETWSGGWSGPSIKGRVVFDLLDAYKRTQLTELDSYRLDAVGESVFGTGKEFHEADVGDLWEDDPERFVEYNLRDVELCVALDRKEDLIAFWREVAAFAGCRLEDVTVPSDVVDRYVLRKTNGRYALPSRGQQSGEEFDGGEVFDASSGVVENVIVLDLASLYPMAMSTLNASPETKVDADEYDGDTRRAPNGVHFRTDGDGIVREIIDELLDERDTKKRRRDEHDPDSTAYEKFDRQQASIKVLMNSLFGVMGWTRFRLYDRDNAGAVTSTGREVLSHTEEIVENLGFEVLYGDTDSVLISLGGDVDAAEAKEIGFEMEAAINDSYDDFAREHLDAEDHRFEVEFEKLYRRYFQAGKKKRYAGHVTWKDGKDTDDIDITGFEYQRSDVAPITKRVQHEVIEMIVHGRENEEIRDRLHEIIVNFREGDVGIGDVGIPMGIGQPLDEYDNDPAHARGSRYANAVLGTNFAAGDKPRRVYLSGVDDAFFEGDASSLGGAASNAENRDRGDFRRRRDVICIDRAERLPDEFHIDWDKMLEKTLQRPLSRVIEPLGIEWDDVRAGQTQEGLDSFM